MLSLRQFNDILLKGNCKSCMHIDTCLGIVPAAATAVHESTCLGAAIIFVFGIEDVIDLAQ